MQKTGTTGWHEKHTKKLLLRDYAVPEIVFVRRRILEFSLLPTPLKVRILRVVEYVRFSSDFGGFVVAMVRN